MHVFFQVGGWRTSVPDYSMLRNPSFIGHKIRTQVAKQELQNMAEGRCEKNSKTRKSLILMDGCWRLGYYKNDGVEETKVCDLIPSNDALEFLCKFLDDLDRSGIPTYMNFQRCKSCQMDDYLILSLQTLNMLNFQGAHSYSELRWKGWCAVGACTSCIGCFEVLGFW